MNDDQIFKGIEDRVEFMIDNVEDLTTEEKILQLQMIGDDMGKLSDPGRQRIVIALLVKFALSDPDSQIRFQILYNFAEEEDE